MCLTILVQAFDGQEDAPAPIAEEMALDFAGQTFDTATAFGLVVTNVEDRDAVFERENLWDTVSHAGFAGTVAANGVIVGDCAACNGLEGVGYSRIEGFAHRNISRWNIARYE